MNRILVLEDARTGMPSIIAQSYVIVVPGPVSFHKVIASPPLLAVKYNSPPKTTFRVDVPRLL